MSHTDVVNVDDADSGTILVKRFKARDTRIRIDLTNPPASECDHRRG